MASKQDYENMGSNFSDVKPKNEPQPNAFSAETFPQTTKNDYKSDTVFINWQKWNVGELKFKETIDQPEETSQELLNGYRTLILFVFIGMIIGTILTTITFFALYGTAIERANLIADTDAMIKKMEYNTNEIRNKIQDNENIIKTVNENIDKLGTGIVSELKPKEAKIVNK